MTWIRCPRRKNGRIASDVCLKCDPKYFNKCEAKNVMTTEEAYEEMAKRFEQDKKEIEIGEKDER